MEVQGLGRGGDGEGVSSLLRRRSALRWGLAVRVDAPMRGHVGHAVSCWAGMYSESGLYP